MENCVTLHKKSHNFRLLYVFLLFSDNLMVTIQ